VNGARAALKPRGARQADQPIVTPLADADDKEVAE
jgi:hypothetical protein